MISTTAHSGVSVHIKIFFSSKHWKKVVTSTGDNNRSPGSARLGSNWLHSRLSSPCEPSQFNRVRFDSSRLKQRLTASQMARKISRKKKKMTRNDQINSCQKNEYGLSSKIVNAVNFILNNLLSLGIVACSTHFTRAQHGSNYRVESSRAKLSRGSSARQCRV